MTVKELYDWAERRHWENFEISIPVADVSYYGNEISISYIQSKKEIFPNLGNGEFIELHSADEKLRSKSFTISLSVEEG